MRTRSKCFLGNHYEKRSLTLLCLTVRAVLLSGTDTNTVTMCWSLFYMASHPEIQEKVHREITEAFGYNDPPGYSEKTGLPFTAATLLEVQRLATVPHVSIIHRATTKGQLAGYTIPEDSWILLSVWSVHRNPKYFPQPFEFRPERFLDKDGRVATDLPVISFSTGKSVLVSGKNMYVQAADPVCICTARHVIVGSHPSMTHRTDS